MHVFTWQSISSDYLVYTFARESTQAHAQAKKLLPHGSEET